jgi:hypothetical protein
MSPVIPTSNQAGRQASNRKRGDEIKKISSPLKLPSQSQPNFAEMILGWFRFLKGRFLCEFLIGFYVKLSSAVGAILVEGPHGRTYF